MTGLNPMNRVTTVHEADEMNVVDVDSAAGVDERNSRFYDRFVGPPPADLFLQFEDRDFWRVMLNQELGYYDAGPLAPGSKIWVAGCGRNQAAQLALRFPRCEVYATDISSQALEAAEGIARQVGATNVSFERKSFFEAQGERFHYVVCTGAVHHTGDPGAALEAISGSLRGDGVLELMVYNRFHRIETSALQKALYLLAGSTDTRDEVRVDLARRLGGAVDANSNVLDVARKLADEHESEVADSLASRIEWSFTVQSLHRLAERAGLNVWLPTQSPQDLAAGRRWTLHFRDDDVRARWQSLPDLERWQIVNLLLAERSPWLWFYLRPADTSRPPRLAGEVLDRFLEATFERAGTTATGYVREPSGQYRRHDRPRAHPTGAPQGALARKLYDAVDGKTPMGQLVQRVTGPCDSSALWELREELAAPHAPFLRSVSAT